MLAVILLVFYTNLLTKLIKKKKENYSYNNSVNLSACQVVVVKLLLLCEKPKIVKNGLNSSKYGGNVQICLEKNKVQQIVLLLENQAADVIPTLEEEKISANNGVDTIIKRLDRI